MSSPCLALYNIVIDQAKPSVTLNQVTTGSTSAQIGICAGGQCNGQMPLYNIQVNIFIGINQDNETELTFSYNTLDQFCTATLIGIVSVVLASKTNPSLIVNASGGAIATLNNTFPLAPSVSVSFTINSNLQSQLILTMSNPITTTSTQLNIFVPVKNNFAISLPCTPTPTTNQDFCTDPSICITATLSPTNGDVLEGVFQVMDNTFYRVASECYQGCTTPINNGTQFAISALFINCTVRGPFGNTGTLLQKFGNQDDLRVSVTGYALTKLILGRLVIDDFDIKWLYQCNYDQLRNRIYHSKFNSFVSVLDMYIELNQYFFCSGN